MGLVLLLLLLPLIPIRLLFVFSRLPGDTISRPFMNGSYAVSAIVTARLSSSEGIRCRVFFFSALVGSEFKMLPVTNCEEWKQI